MREITKIMIKKYALMKLKYDFAGYNISNINQLSFHHLILSHRECKKQGLGEGFYEWNGAILVQKTSHDYLHTIEQYDYDMFSDITSHMIDENAKGYLDIEDIKAIDDILTCFEREYCGTRTKKGYPLIKSEYVDQRLILKK